MTPSPTNSPSVPDAPTPRVVVLGLGGAGLRVVSRLAAHPDAGWLTIAGVDTDEQALRDSHLEHRFAVGTEWTQGQGCGGDPQRGGRAMAHKTQKEVERFVDQASLVFVLGGMGGGVATGGAPVLGRLFRRLQVPAMFLVTLPFSFEGHARREVAEEGLRQLFPDAEVVVPLPNDLLFAHLSADTPAQAAFLAADEALAGAVLNLAGILRCQSLLPADFADFRTLLGKRKSCCAVGFAETPYPGTTDSMQALLEQLLVSPLLGGAEQLAKADALVAVLAGGPSFSIGEMKQLLEAVQRLCSPACRIITGATSLTGGSERRRLTVLAVKFDPDDHLPPLIDSGFRLPKPSPASRSRVAPSGELRSTELVQTELSLFRLDRGIFANTTPNIYEGVDLDVPTFQRQEITLDKGK